MIKQITQEKLDEALVYLNPRAAMEVLNSAEQTGQPQLSREDSVKLRYVRMVSLPVEAVLDLMRESVLIAYTLPDFKLSELVERYVASSMDAEVEVDLMQGIIEILEHHQESLGSNNIEINGKPFPPTIENWIKDYNSFYGDRGEHDALNQLKYLGSTPNLKGLPIEIKDVLLDILKLYDRANNLMLLWDNLEIPEQASQVVPPNAIEEFLPDLSEDSAEPEPEKPEENDLSVPAFQIPLQKNLDLSTSQRSGLVFDQQTNVDFDAENQKRAEEKRNQLAIQDKLEALKKRSGIDESDK